MSEPNTWPQATPFEKAVENACLVALAGLILYSIYIYGQLPAEIPHHFNSLGEPDSWGHKSIIFALPGIALFLYVLMTLLSKSPSNLINSFVRVTKENENVQFQIVREQLRIIKLLCILLIAYLTWGVAQAGLGKIETLSTVVLYGFIALMLVVIFWYYRKAKANA